MTHLYLYSHQLTLFQTQVLEPNKVDAENSLTHQMSIPANLGFTPPVNTEEHAMSIY